MRYACITSGEKEQKPRYIGGIQYMTPLGGYVVNNYGWVEGFIRGLIQGNSKL